MRDQGRYPANSNDDDDDADWMMHELEDCLYIAPNGERWLALTAGSFEAADFPMPDDAGSAIADELKSGWITLPLSPLRTDEDGRSSVPLLQ